MFWIPMNLLAKTKEEHCLWKTEYYKPALLRPLFQPNALLHSWDNQSEGGIIW